MSFATSTDLAQQVRPKADPTSSGEPTPGEAPTSGGQRQPEGRGVRLQRDQGFQPWQFFVLAALACATAVTFLARSQGPTAVILLSVLMGATALAGLAALRVVLPLVTSQEGQPPIVGNRTRTALEREKTLALRAIKELEFDRAMGKVSEDDFREMSGRLRSRAARLMRQLDAGAGYRERIERDLAKRLGEKTTPGPKDPAYAESGKASSETKAKTCAKCSTPNDTDARFCKNCGEKL